jgi:hypothetical protein
MVGLKKVTASFYAAQPFIGAPISLDAPMRSGRSWYDVIATPSS